MKNNSKKPQLGLLGFVYKYKITLLFLVVFIALFQQNILINGFPMVVYDRQETINNIKLENVRLNAENEALKEQLDNYRDKGLVLIESQARYKYGLIKDGETYYQINTLIEVDNSDETPESNL